MTDPAPDARLYDVCQFPGCGADISHRGWHAKWCSKRHADRGWHLANPGAQRRYLRKCVYGLTDERFNQLVAVQDGRCGICGKVPSVATGHVTDQWNVDHCHDSGVVRGLLCSGCNIGIGQLGDDPARVRAAIAYIENYLAHPLRLPEPMPPAPAAPAADVEMRYCSRCDRHLTREFFAPSVWATSKRKAWCTGCYTAAVGVRRRGDLPEPGPYRSCEAPGCDVDISHMRAHARWCSKSCTAKGWRHENPGARREYLVKTLYGITAGQADAVLDMQGGVCAICGTGETTQWNVDHCHATGAPRGILCSGCNTGIGSLGDDPALLRQALAYLENPPALNSCGSGVSR